jgi:hypothetical protein
LVSPTDPSKNYFDEDRVISSNYSQSNSIEEEIADYIFLCLADLPEEYTYLIVTSGGENATIEDGTKNCDIYFVPTSTQDKEIIDNVLHYNINQDGWSIGSMNVIDNNLDNNSYLYFGSYWEAPLTDLDSLTNMIEDSINQAEEDFKESIESSEEYIEVKEELDKAIIEAGLAQDLVDSFSSIDL